MIAMLKFINQQFLMKYIKTDTHIKINGFCEGLSWDRKQNTAAQSAPGV